MHGRAPVPGTPAPNRDTRSVAAPAGFSRRAWLPGTHKPASAPGLAATLAAIVLALGACDSRPIAIGDIQAINMTASPELWAHVGDEVLDGIEGGIFTVRDDYAFRVMYQDPNEEPWVRIRLFKQLLVIGTPADPWMGPVLAEVGVDQGARVGTPDSPGTVQVYDVWSRGQLVTALVLPEGTGTAAAAEMVRQSIPGLRELFDAQYREWVIARMFFTGPDTVQARMLGEEHGFSMVFPEVYEYEMHESVHIFINDNPDPSELIRQFAVTWRSPGPEETTTDEILEWRSQVVESYDFPQVVNTEHLLAEWREVGGRPVYSVQAIWQNPPGAYPAAGPFITWAVACPELGRTYLIDAWLYAPEKDKYEYMIQLDEILKSFRCVGD